MPKDPEDIFVSLDGPRTNSEVHRHKSRKSKKICQQAKKGRGQKKHSSPPNSML